MKYIVMLNQKNQEEMLVVFPDFINHDCMAEVLGRIRNQTHDNWERIYRAPISAGFINAEGYCYGRSESLRLESRPKVDTALFQKGF